MIKSSDELNENNKNVRNTIIIKPIGIKSDSYVEYNVDSNEKKI